MPNQAFKTNQKSLRGQYPGASVLFPPLVYMHVQQGLVSGLTVSPSLNSLYNYIIVDGPFEEWTNTEEKIDSWPMRSWENIK